MIRIFKGLNIRVFECKNYSISLAESRKKMILGRFGVLRKVIFPR